MNSKYWLREMNNANVQKENLILKSDKYNEYVSKLIRLRDGLLFGVNNNAEYASKLLAQGGFNYDGTIPLNDEYLSGIKNLNECIDDLNVLIENTTNKINDFEKNITSLQTKYNSAKSSYEKALKEENE